MLKLVISVIYYMKAVESPKGGTVAFTKHFEMTCNIEPAPCLLRTVSKLMFNTTQNLLYGEVISSCFIHKGPDFECMHTAIVGPHKDSWSFCG